MANKKRPEPPKYPKLFDQSGLGAIPMVIGLAVIPIGVPIFTIAGAILGGFGIVGSGIFTGALMGAGVVIGSSVSALACTFGYASIKKAQDKAKVAKYNKEYKKYAKEVKRLGGQPDPAENATSGIIKKLSDIGIEIDPLQKGKGKNKQQKKQHAFLLELDSSFSDAFNKKASNVNSSKLDLKETFKEYAAIADDMYKVIFKNRADLQTTVKAAGLGPGARSLIVVTNDNNVRSELKTLPNVTRVVSFN